MFQIPSRLASTGRKLLRAQRELARPVSVFCRETLRGKIVGAVAQFRVLAGRYAREEAPLKGQEALAAANFQSNKSAAAELAAIRQEFSLFRASFEAEAKANRAEAQANRALGESLLSALVSSPFCSVFPSADF